MRIAVKQVLQAWLPVCLFMMVTFVTSCKKDKDPKPNEQDVFLEQLSTNWKVSEARVDEVDVTDAFENLTLSFTKEKTYSATNSVAPIWPASGTFTVDGATANAFTLQRSDGVVVKVISISTTRLELEFNCSAPTNRTKQVTGRYEFVFIK